MPTRPPLPIDDHLDAVRAALDRRRAAVLVAAPGAGKTTRVPPALAQPGRVVVLQPRRVAARAVARRMAAESGWTIGREVGWHIRFERRCTAETRVVVVTEGMLTAYLDEDPLLQDTATVVLDEFHERSLHADLGLALVKQAWRARDDLRVLVMSATIDPGPVSAFLDDCPVVTVPGTTHPLRVEYAPGQSVAGALADLLPATTSGTILAFLPGAGEIERAAREAAEVAARHDAGIVPLHGSLDADAQDRAIGPSAGRRVVLATNIAETSLTVPGVATVVDTGLQKVARYDAERAIDALVLERVTRDSADQRAGRAAPGARPRPPPLGRARPAAAAREPEIRRVDLCATVLGVLAAGDRLESFEWFEAPDSDRLDAAMTLLRRLGAIDDGRVTRLGHALRRLPLHPRLGRVSAGGGAFEVAAACAWLSERGIPVPRVGSTTCDLLPVLDRWGESPRTPGRWPGSSSSSRPMPWAKGSRHMPTRPR
ncbi:MAG: helicase-related protein [Vicinamibacterales bacterium]